jgi:hypothetical protein
VDGDQAPGIRVTAHGFGSAEHDSNAAMFAAWIATTAIAFCAQSETWPVYRAFHLKMVQAIEAGPDVVRMAESVTREVTADLVSALIDGQRQEATRRRG